MIYEFRNTNNPNDRISLDARTKHEALLKLHTILVNEHRGATQYEEIKVERVSQRKNNPKSE